MTTRGLASLLPIPAVLMLMLAAVACDQTPRVEPTGSTPPPAQVGEISGEVTLSGQTNHMGVLVYCAGTNQVALTDSEGRFTFTNLPFGEYQLGARHEGYSDAMLGLVALSDESRIASLDPVTLPMAPVDVIALPPPERGSLAGRAVYEGETDHIGIRVSLVDSPLRTFTDERGNWLLQDVDNGEYEIVFYAPSYRTETLTAIVQRGSFTSLPQVVLTRDDSSSSAERGDMGRRIFGTISLVDGSGSLGSDYTDVWVVIEGTDHIAAPDDTGHFEFISLSNRVYSVAARGPSGSHSESTIVDLREDSEREISLFLEIDGGDEAEGDGGSITGTIALADGGSPVGATVGVAGSSHTAIAGQGGRFTITGVPAGEVTVLAQAPGHETLSVPSVNVVDGQSTDVGTLTLQMERIPPRVIAADPADGERDVLLEPMVPVFIRFSEPMDVSSVKSAVRITPSGPHQILMGREHPETDYDLMLILLHGGAGGIQLQDRVEITVNTDARSAAGVAMAENYELGFRMGRPSLYASIPHEGDQAFPSDQPIQLLFNTPLRMDEIDTGFSFSPSPPTIPQIIPRVDPETGWTIVDIRAMLTPNRSYTIRMNGRIRSESGDRLSGRRDLRFHTAPQIVPDQFGHPTQRDDSVIY